MKTERRRKGSGVTHWLRRRKTSYQNVMSQERVGGRSKRRLGRRRRRRAGDIVSRGKNPAVYWARERRGHKRKRSRQEPMYGRRERLGVQLRRTTPKEKGAIKEVRRERDAQKKKGKGGKKERARRNRHEVRSYNSDPRTGTEYS